MKLQMNKLIPHIPAYISIPDLPIEEFSTLDELLKLDHVKKFKGEALAMSDNHLMAIKDNGKHWWVIGRIEGNMEDITIPKWESFQMPNPLIIVE